MRPAIDVDQERRGRSVEGLRPDQFIDAQFRKTELRRLYQDTRAADRVGKLMRAIEQDVIPRLVAVRHPATEIQRPACRSNDVDEAQVARFARILLGHEVGLEPSAFVAEVRAAGVSLESIYLNLLAPAARHVGTLWEDDLCTFVDVTLALSALHRVLLALTSDDRFEPHRIDPARRLLLVQPPGSAHTFGLRMVAEFFRRGAWSVDIAPALLDAKLGAMVRAAWFTVIGFSVACEPNVDDLAATVRCARRCSANPKVGILVGGPAIVANPDLVGRVGADGMAVDAIQAVLEAERFVLHTGVLSAADEDRGPTA